MFAYFIYVALVIGGGSKRDAGNGCPLSRPILFFHFPAAFRKICQIPNPQLVQNLQFPLQDWNSLNLMKNRLHIGKIPLKLIEIFELFVAAVTVIAKNGVRTLSLKRSGKGP